MNTYLSDCSSAGSLAQPLLIEIHLEHDMTNLQSFSVFLPALLLKRWCFFVFFRIFGHDDTHPTLRLVISFIYFGLPMRCIFGYSLISRIGL